MIKAAIHYLSKSGVGQKIGYCTFSDTQGGLLIEPDINGLPKGDHGFHIHEFGNLEPSLKKNKRIAGGCAGQHYDPLHAGFHGHPDGCGHLGDLPVLEVDEYGIADFPVLAPRLNLDDVRGRAIIIHECGDNYSDMPLPNGGGRSRIAGGVITDNCPYCKPDAKKSALQMLVLAGACYLLGRG